MVTQISRFFKILGFCYHFLVYQPFSFRISAIFCLVLKRSILGILSHAGGVCGGYPPPALRPLGSVNAGPIILHGWWMPENAAGLRLHRVLFWRKDIHTKCVSTQKLGSYTNEGVQSQGPIGNYR